MISAETAASIAARVRSGALSAAEAVETSLRRIGEVEARLNCFTEVYVEDARAAAARIDALTPSEKAGMALCGVPVAIKDFTPIAGKRTTYGSIVYAEHVATEDPVIVRRLRAAGAIIIGHTTTPEFAHSGFTHSRLWGVTRNPFDPSRTPGGSSGGSAVAVATGCVPLAEGTDMGGSVRIPAALCGIVGLKPSYGRIPMDILDTHYDQISHFGPLARTVEDAALFLSVVEGPSDEDANSLPPLPAVLPIPELKAPRFAASVDLGFYAPTIEVRDLFEETLSRLARAGAIIERSPLRLTVQAAQDAISLWAYAFAGDRGHLLPQHRADLDPCVIELIEAGQKLSAVDLRAIEHRRSKLWPLMNAALAGHDAFLCPTTCMTAPEAEGTDPGVERFLPEGRYRALDMTTPFNLLSACPAISVPMGLASDGLPAGLQIVARRHDDRAALAAARFVERALRG